MMVVSVFVSIFPPTKTLTHHCLVSVSFTSDLLTYYPQLRSNTLLNHYVLTCRPTLTKLWHVPSSTVAAFMTGSMDDDTWLNTIAVLCRLPCPHPSLECARTRIAQHCPIRFCMWKARPLLHHNVQALDGVLLLSRFVAFVCRFGESLFHQ